jgi:hypothetical protein
MFCNTDESLLSILAQHDVTSINVRPYMHKQYPLHRYHISIKQQHATIIAAIATPKEQLSEVVIERLKKISKRIKLQKTEKPFPTKIDLENKLYRLLKLSVSIIEFQQSIQHKKQLSMLPHALSKFYLGDKFKTQYWAIKIIIGPVCYKQYRLLVENTYLQFQIHQNIQKTVGTLSQYIIEIHVYRNSIPYRKINQTQLKINSWL